MNAPDAINAEACDKHNRQFGYAGDISVNEAWKLLEKKADTVLVDVRTPQEWEQIGLPDIANLNKDTILLTWKMGLPSGEANSQFVSEFSRLHVALDTPVLLLCRSGGRSQAAACALTAAGYSRCFNISSGFEGRGGWKDSGLPRKQ